MTKIKAIAAGLMAALATLSLASAPASAGGRPVSIQGKGTGTIRLNTTTGAVTGKESGVSSHIGQYKLRLQGVVTRSADGTVTGHGTVTIVAARGDRMTGTFTLTGQDQTNTVDVTITGGTGRFANASGTLTVVCVASAPPHQVGPILVLEHKCTMTGEISD